MGKGGGLAGERKELMGPQRISTEMHMLGIQRSLKKYKRPVQGPQKIQSRSNMCRTNGQKQAYLQQEKGSSIIKYCKYFAACDFFLHSGLIAMLSRIARSLI